MGVQIKRYYCPKCQSFKEWHGVITTNEFPISNYCRFCGTECYDTEVLLEMMISEKATALWAGEKRNEENEEMSKVSEMEMAYGEYLND